MKSTVRTDMDGMMEVIEVDAAQLQKHGGADWVQLRDLAAQDDSPIVLRKAQYGGVNQTQERHKGWLPPTDKDDRELPWLPIDRAWLREHDDRAFLYRQNW